MNELCPSTLLGLIIFWCYSTEVVRVFHGAACMYTWQKVMFTQDLLDTFLFFIHKTNAVVLPDTRKQQSTGRLYHFSCFVLLVMLH